MWQYQNFSKNFFLHNKGDYPPKTDKMTYIRGDTGGRGAPIGGYAPMPEGG